MKDYRFIFEKKILGSHWGWRDQRNYEQEVQKAVKKIQGDLFVDIGARQLFYPLRLAENFVQIIAFEPNRNVKIPPHPANIRVRNEAISDKTGKVMFYCQNNGGADGLIKDFNYWVPPRGYAPAQTGPFHSAIDSFEVNTLTYDDAVPWPVELVMVDVEGAEFMVIEGMTKHLPLNIIIELHDVRRETELLGRMSNKGYFLSNAQKLDVTHWLFRK